MDDIKVMELLLDEADLSSGVFATSLVASPAIETSFVALSEEKPNFKLEFQADDDKMILTGPLLIPDQLIYRYDEFQGPHYVYASADTIEKVAIKFAKDNNSGNITHEHKKILNGNLVFESWIIADSEKDKSANYGYSLPEGTWMISVKVNDIDYWNKYIKSGKVKGFSLEGFFKKELSKEKPKTKKQKSNFSIMEKFKQLLQFFTKDKVKLFTFYLADGTAFEVGEDMMALVFDSEGNEIGKIHVLLNSEEMPMAPETVIEETKEEVIVEEKETMSSELNVMVESLKNEIASLKSDIAEMKTKSHKEINFEKEKSENFEFKNTEFSIASLLNKRKQ